jgi:hypothetical protein
MDLNGDERSHGETRAGAGQAIRLSLALFVCAIDPEQHRGPIDGPGPLGWSRGLFRFAPGFGAWFAAYGVGRNIRLLVTQGYTGFAGYFFNNRRTARRSHGGKAGQEHKAGEKAT